MHRNIHARGLRLSRTIFVTRWKHRERRSIWSVRKLVVRNQLTQHCMLPRAIGQMPTPTPPSHPNTLRIQPNHLRKVIKDPTHRLVLVIEKITTPAALAGIFGLQMNAFATTEQTLLSSPKQPLQVARNDVCRLS